MLLLRQGLHTFLKDQVNLPRSVFLSLESGEKNHSHTKRGLETIVFTIKRHNLVYTSKTFGVVTDMRTC